MMAARVDPCSVFPSSAVDRSTLRAGHISALAARLRESTCWVASVCIKIVYCIQWPCTKVYCSVPTPPAVPTFAGDVCWRGCGRWGRAEKSVQHLGFAPPAAVLACGAANDRNNGGRANDVDSSEVPKPKSLTIYRQLNRVAALAEHFYERLCFNNSSVRIPRRRR